MSVNILFWNIKKNAGAFSLIAEAIRLLDVNICILAEFPNNTEYELRPLLPEGYHIPRTPQDNDKLVFIHGSNVNMLLAGEIEYSRGLMFSTRINESPSFNIVGCHLVDSRNHGEFDRSYLATSFHKSLRKVETELGNDKTIVIGDFNMNPFDKGMSCVYTFNAVMDRRIARKQKKKYQHYEFPYFYNPMWYFLGHPEHANGTLLYTGDDNWYHWNLYDQVLLRPSLIDHFDHRNIKIITEIGDNKLLTSQDKIRSDISDHLPIYISLNI